MSLPVRQFASLQRRVFHNLLRRRFDMPAFPCHYTSRSESCQVVSPLGIPSLCYALACVLIDKAGKVPDILLILIYHEGYMYRLIDHLWCYIISKRNEDLTTDTGLHRHQTRVNDAVMHNLRSSSLLRFFHSCACCLPSDKCPLHMLKFEDLRSQLIERFGSVKCPQNERARYARNYPCESVVRYWLNLTRIRVIDVNPPEEINDNNVVEIMEV